MKQYTAEELKVMSVKELGDYFDRLHKANA